MIDSNGYLKLIDFGISKYCLTRTYTICGFAEYLAPEIILNIGYDSAVDLWALGILIFEMKTKTNPFNDEDPIKFYKNILAGRVKYQKNFDPKAKSLVKHLLNTDQKTRYKINEVYKHKWFKYFDWYDLEKKNMKAEYVPGLWSQ